MNKRIVFNRMEAAGFIAGMVVAHLLRWEKLSV
jgi:hypothetical protein